MKNGTARHLSLDGLWGERSPNGCEREISRTASMPGYLDLAAPMRSRAHRQTELNVR